MDHDLDSVLGWRGRTVLDRNGEKIGKIGELYLDEDTDRPAYAGVKTGLLGLKESIVPLDGVTEHEGDLVVPYDAGHVRDAPSLDPDTALEPDEADRLADHYDAGDRTEHVGEVTRTEEEARFDKTPMQPKERVRIKKVLVEDQVEQTVPVRREEVRLETDPPPEGRIERVEDVEER